MNEHHSVSVGPAWWNWHPEGRMLFETIDRQAWKQSGHNPDKMLREIPVKCFSTVDGEGIKTVEQIES